MIMRMGVVNAVMEVVVVVMAVPARRGRPRGSGGITVVGHGVKRQKEEYRV